MEEFSNIRVRPYQSEKDPELVAWLSLTYNGFIHLNSIKVKNKEDRIIFEWPGRHMPDGKVFYNFQPVSSVEAQKIYDACIGSIESALARA